MKLTAAAAATVLCLSTSWALAAAPDKLTKKAAGPALEVASAEQMDAASRALTGAYECEFNQSIAVEANPRFPGYIDIKFQKAVFTMKPIQSSTGALRLEEAKKGGKKLWLQIANKSMLMDGGHRIVDGCTHASQREAMAK